MMLVYLLAFVSALVLSLSLTPIVIKIAYKFGYVAKPNQLRWHKNTTALLGGIGIFVAFLIPTFFF
ncbi:MAG: undecaprenyl/decaprenyl-phosphate alpha-N-acetylglucosaminyl 1-phosphate transferase, partial [Candidatus Omnitrophica bacterium]|nr:undecaprenyl/decaprenyl-phosphate alpha-N-acetylglucosaminyl 1-phosphate transferase [Candidatus Omnitrophota bacterium]